MQGLPGIILCLDKSNLNYNETASFAFNQLLKNGFSINTFCNGKAGLGFFLNGQN
jgi:hypothetical protein